MHCCDICNYLTTSNYNLKVHYRTKKHISMVELVIKNNKKSESNTESYKRITGENNKVIKNMLDKATENKKAIKELTDNLQIELHNSEELKNALEIERNAAIEDLDATLKKSQNELIKTIVKSALFVIMSVGFITTIMYSFAILSDKDTQIIGSTWSNMFSVLLTNAFSIVGTIMGIKYATQDSDKTKTTK